MKTISLKKKYVFTGGWRGYEQPINAIAGANNTGNYSDSPCPDSVCREELKRAKQALKKAKIPYRQTWCRSSNVFCIHGYICVPESLRDEAKKQIEPLISETRLLYLC
jgi:hypothetical protein